MAPSLVTCPAMNTGVCVALAQVTSLAAHSRTWDTPPGAMSRSEV